jgi:hypothetical protein
MIITFDKYVRQKSIFYFSDTDPSKLHQFQFDVLPGNFVDVADDQLEDDFFDAIVTTFFIETAQNPLTYVDIIYRY